MAKKSVSKSNSRAQSQPEKKAKTRTSPRTAAAASSVASSAAASSAAASESNSGRSSPDQKPLEVRKTAVGVRLVIKAFALKELEAAAGNSEPPQKKKTKQPTPTRAKRAKKSERASTAATAPRVSWQERRTQRSQWRMELSQSSIPSAYYYGENGGFVSGAPPYSTYIPQRQYFELSCERSTAHWHDDDDDMTLSPESESGTSCKSPFLLYFKLLRHHLTLTAAGVRKPQTIRRRRTDRRSDPTGFELRFRRGCPASPSFPSSH
jgi:hypothetical protein